MSRSERFGTKRSPGAYANGLRPEAPKPTGVNLRIGRIAAVAAAVAALSGCVPQLFVHVEKPAEDLTGESVQRTIDQQYASLLSSWPELHARPSICPEHLDLRGGKVGHCRLPVSDAVLPIAVSAGKVPGSYDMRPERALLAARRLESDLGESLSRDYGVPLTLACGPPAAMVLAVGTRFRCALRGAGTRARYVDLKVVALDGKVFVYRLPGMHRAFELGPYLTAHKHGQPTRVPGAAVERMISAASFRVANGKRVRATAVCPALLDLSGAKHARCTMSAAGHRLAYDTWIDEPNGIHIAPLQVIISTKRVRDEAAKRLTEKLRAAGSTDMVSVDCGPDRLVVYAPKDTFPCAVLTSDGKSRPLTVTVVDVAGTVNYYVPPLPGE
jgi:hypothetical protein